eukprot:scaffold50665_cov30-Tisochrysis_lutea.AAC.4
MYNPSIGRRRPNTGGFRLTPCRDSAGVSMSERRHQAAVASRRTTALCAWALPPSEQAAERPQLQPQLPPPPQSLAAGAEAVSTREPRLRKPTVDGNEVGMLTGLVRHSEQVVQGLLESLRTLKEKNRLLVEADAARRSEVAAAVQRERDAQTLVDELHDRVDHLLKDKEALRQENVQGVANAARLVELAAAERSAAQQREQELMRLLSQAHGVKGGDGEQTIAMNESELQRRLEEGREQMRIEFRLEMRKREGEVRTELASVKQELEIERRRHAKSRADALAAKFRATVTAAQPQILCSKCRNLLAADGPHVEDGPHVTSEVQSAAAGELGSTEPARPPKPVRARSQPMIVDAGVLVEEIKATGGKGSETVDVNQVEGEGLVEGSLDEVRQREQSSNVEEQQCSSSIPDEAACASEEARYESTLMNGPSDSPAIDTSFAPASSTPNAMEDVKNAEARAVLAQRVVAAGVADAVNRYEKWLKASSATVEGKRDKDTSHTILSSKPAQKVEAPFELVDQSNELAASELSRGDGISKGTVSPLEGIRKPQSMRGEEDASAVMAKGDQESTGSPSARRGATSVHGTEETPLIAEREPSSLGVESLNELKRESEARGVGEG